VLGASRNSSNCKLNVEGRSAPEKNLRAEAQQEKLSEPASLDGQQRIDKLIPKCPTLQCCACQEDYEDPDDDESDEDAGYGRNGSKFGTLLEETGLSQEDIDFIECNMGPAIFEPLCDLMRQRNSET